MTLRHVLLGGVVIAATAFPACLEPTEITFVITTNQPCSTFGGTGISVGDLDDKLTSAPYGSESKACDDGMPHLLGKIVVTPGKDPTREVAVRIVTGVGKTPDACLAQGFTTGCIVARRALHFLSHSPITVPVDMDVSCLNIPCESTETCRGGTCVDVHSLNCGPACNDGGTDAGPDAGPLPSQWSQIKTPPEGREWASGFWSGKEAWFWGGTPNTMGWASDGYRWSPSQMQWTNMPAAMFGNGVNHRACSASGKIIAWGGDAASQEGFVFDGTQWATMTSQPMVASRRNHAVVCGPDGMTAVVWGGWDVNSKPLNTGATYVSGTWTTANTAPLTGRGEPRAVWVAGKVVILGGDNGGPQADGAAFDPVANKWSQRFVIPVARVPNVVATDGKVAIFWGSENAAATASEITLVDPSTDPPTVNQVGSMGMDPNAPSLRHGAAGWYSNGRLWIWGGATFGTEMPLATGASYDFATKQWIPMPAGPSARLGHSIVWTGTEAILYGGLGPPLSDGGPGIVNDAWSFH